MTTKLLRAAHQRIGAARRLVDEFWCRRDAANPRNPETAWAMHVVLVQLYEVLKRGAREPSDGWPEDECAA